jgi:hypothetical protein
LERSRNKTPGRVFQTAGDVLRLRLPSNKTVFAVSTRQIPAGEAF